MTNPDEGLRLTDVSVAFGDKVAVDRVDLHLPAGHVLAVLGPSGCGKSTLLRAVAGLETLRSGEISYAGERVEALPTHRRGFALMFQDGQLFGHLDVARNVGYSLRLRKVGRREITERVGELLDLVGLAGFERRLPGTLSGGERQRVALARALATNPRVLLLDEPLSALDASLRERLAADLRTILQASGTTALMVTHDHEEAFTVADRLAVMREGRLVQEGLLDEVWRAPADDWAALFLGYPRVLRGEAAAKVLAAADRPHDVRSDGSAVALRRSALVADPEGTLDAEVLQARVTPEQLRLVIEVTGVGELDAVAPLGAALAPGHRVRLRLRTDRVAFPADPPSVGSNP